MGSEAPLKAGCVLLTVVSVRTVPGSLLDARMEHLEEPAYGFLCTLGSSTDLGFWDAAAPAVD